MAWENVITGYKIKSFQEDDIIPTDAKFLESYSYKPLIAFPAVTMLRFLIPIYKKQNVKKKP